MSKVADMKRCADEFLSISHNSKTFIPNFVNIGFACELYLKLILQQATGKYRRTHDLECLYDKAVKHIDESDFLQILARKIQATFIEIKIVISKDEARHKLEEMFDSHRTIFVDWRYYFDLPADERGVVDMTLPAFANALKEFTEQMHT